MMEDDTTKRPDLSLAVIEDLKGKGYTQSDIAKMYGVTRQYVSWIKSYYGGRLTPREEVLQHFPFQVSAYQSQTSPYRRLREHGEYMATGGVGMDKIKLGRLRGFYAKLRDHVLEFNPEFPPEPGVSSRGGWRYVPRVSDDDDLLIRVNEYTDLTERGAMIWRFPPVEP
ncbi:transcriptional repressor [Mycobacterium phage Severus]|uniref:transcriptional repressor n=1 Tax=Mycobacterium phage Severus TaxID=1327776 RepID=UPI00032B50B1|nr:transcriptional repressor [Mycobacterium phage Severus]AGK88000.1 immunity repressor [Mycobacterium phage Severus]AVO22467.1 immunity repressor [Mycobacterium phage KittenMittens]